MPDMNAVQDELMDMIISDESPSTISDKIKDMLYAKSAEKVDGFRPEVANATFNPPDQSEVEASAEVEDEVEPAEPEAGEGEL